jgi:GT2 family glycosyltransferase
LPPDSNDPPELAQQLLLRQAEVEARLYRVEDSLLFRALRWAGRKVGYPRGAGERDNSRAYANWVEQSGWTAPSAREIAHSAAAWRDQPRISYLTGSADAAASVSAQTVPALETLHFADAGAWTRAVCQAQGDYSVIVPEGARLAPLASYRWGEWLQDTSADAIYSDWDRMDGSGRRHAPAFTPEFSPELLRHSGYWGSCSLVRTSLLKEVGPGLNPAEQGWMHSLALRIAQTTGAVARIPEILWHATSAAESIDHRANTVGGEPGEAEQASIVICTRTPRLLRKCLEALRRSDAAQAEIVVVAHDCGAGAKLEEIATAHGARAVLYSGQFHFGVMNGLGVRHSSRPCVVLLNDDVEPIAPNWLGALLRPLQKKTVGITGGLLLYPDDTVQHAGVSVGGWPSPVHVGRGVSSSPWWPWLRCTREVAAVTGACLALRRTLWEELDGFDRRFPVNYNDVDLCLRARRSGYSVVLESAAVLRHFEAQTRNTAVTPGERALFYSLWTPALASADPFFNPNLSLRDERIALAHPCFGS